MPDSEAKKSWDAANTTFVGLKLNNRTDADILAALEGKQKQMEIKRLIRIGLDRCEKTPSDQPPENKDSRPENSERLLP